MRRLACSLAVVLAALAAASTAALAAPNGSSSSKVSYRPPVKGEIVDPFRPPPEPWLAGNRGIDYRPGAGTPVKASADGEVVFAGQVGGELHVVILHADGIRTSYSFLQSIVVQRGDRVHQGAVVGASSEGLHFGARVGDEYIDPRTLFDAEAPHVYLVPNEMRRSGTEAEERAGLVRFLGGAATFAKGYWDAVVSQYRAIDHWTDQLKPGTHVKRLLGTTVDWWRQRGDCTPADVAPPLMRERRIAVLVAGLGSDSQRDAIDGVAPIDLGYVSSVRFSYNGGSTDDSSYVARDTTKDLEEQARRLRDLLAQVHRRHPGEAVDIIAHSQGGVIARQTLAFLYDAEDPRLPVVRNLVTLASPHQGTDAATALHATSHTLGGKLLQHAIDATGLAPFDPDGSSIHQLAETSDFIRDLNERPLPEAITFTSIGSRADVMVPGIHTAVTGARNVIVSVPGLQLEHSALPGSDQGRREVALAVAGFPPTCQSLGDMLVDTAVSDTISTGEDIAAAAAFTGLQWIDGRLP